jgi:hypothetical protein
MALLVHKVCYVVMESPCVYTMLVWMNFKFLFEMLFPPNLSILCTFFLAIMQA